MEVASSREISEEDGWHFSPFFNDFCVVGFVCVQVNGPDVTATYLEKKLCQIKIK